MPQQHITEFNVSADVIDTAPENACVNYDSCGNEIPHNGKMCGECLDRLRHRDSNNDT